MEELLKSALQNGFAVAVAGYLLIRMEKEIKALKESIDKLTIILQYNTLPDSKMIIDLKNGVKNYDVQNKIFSA